MRSHSIAMLAIAMLTIAMPTIAAFSCSGDIEAPSLCVEKDHSMPMCETNVSDAEVLFIVHTLPPGVTPPGPVHITLDTPCVHRALDARHVEGKAVVPLVAPLGSSCGLRVTAAIANSELSQSLDGADQTGCEADIMKCPTSTVTR
jgi:hypothetical protein